MKYSEHTNKTFNQTKHIEISRSGNLLCVLYYATSTGFYTKLFNFSFPEERAVDVILVLTFLSSLLLFSDFSEFLFKPTICIILE